MWQPAPILFPDVVALVADQLRLELPPEIKVGMDLSRWKRPQPSVQIQRMGGTSDGLHDEAWLQVDVRTSTHDSCLDLMNEVRMRMTVLPLRLEAIKRVRESGGLQWLADADEGQPRMAMDFRVVCAGVAQTV